MEYYEDIHVHGISEDKHLQRVKSNNELGHNFQRNCLLRSTQVLIGSKPPARVEGQLSPGVTRCLIPTSHVGPFISSVVVHIQLDES